LILTKNYLPASRTSKGASINTQRRDGPAFQPNGATRPLIDKNRLLTLAENAGNMGHWGWDLADDSVAFSDQVLEMLGRPQPPPATLDDALALCHPEERDGVREQLDDAIANRSGFEFDVRVRHTDGGFRTLIIKGQPEYDGAKRLIAMYGIASDVTEAFAAIHALQDSTEMLALAAALARLGHWVWSKEEERLSFCSDEMARLHGLSTDAFLEQYAKPERLAACVVPEHRERYDDIVRRAIAGGHSYETEYRIELADGTRREIREIGQPIFARGGRFVRFIATAQDITDDKRREAELTRAKMRLEVQADSLKRSEAKLRHVVEGSLQGIIVVRDSRPLFANQAYAAMMGYASPEEVIARSEFSKCPICQEIASGAVSVKRRLNIMAQDGRSLWVDFIGRPIDWDGSPAMLLTVIDVTEQELAQAELRRKTVELQELNLQKDKLFSIIAHDLRSPFNSVMGFADLLAAKARELSPGKVASYAQMVRESAGGVHDLLDNLLAWASYQIRDGALKLVPLDLAVTATSSLEPLVHMAEAKGITVVNAISNTWVLGDEALVRIVIRNLVSNGIKFSRNGGYVRISAARVDDPSPMIRVTVRDDGVGIPAGADLFKLGTGGSSPGTRGEKGTGLGLYLCHDIITRHGGTISVDPATGAGAAFHFTLPTAPARAP
jgi:PAS domain S-box-containing protein